MGNILRGIFLLIFTLVMVWIMASTGNPLKTATTPSGILNLELARNNKEVDKVVQQWNQLNLIPTAKKNTYYDFIFLAGYTSFFYFVLRQILKQFKPGTVKRKMSSVLSYAAILAGVMDILENIGMLLSLSGHLNKGITLFTFSSSIIKWFLVCISISWILFTAFILLAWWLSGKNKIDSAFAK